MDAAAPAAMAPAEAVGLVALRRGERSTGAWLGPLQYARVSREADLRREEDGAALRALYAAQDGAEGSALRFLRAGGGEDNAGGGEEEQAGAETEASARLLCARDGDVEVYALGLPPDAGVLGYRDGPPPRDLFAAEVLLVRPLQAFPPPGPLTLARALREAAPADPARDAVEAYRGQQALLGGALRFFRDYERFRREHGYAHRDLRPENVLVGPAAWTVLDHGCARLRGMRAGAPGDTGLEALALLFHVLGRLPVPAETLRAPGRSLANVVEALAAERAPFDPSALGLPDAEAVALGEELAAAHAAHAALLREEVAPLVDALRAALPALEALPLMEALYVQPAAELQGPLLRRDGTHNPRLAHLLRGAPVVRPKPTPQEALPTALLTADDDGENAMALAGRRRTGLPDVAVAVAIGAPPLSLPPPAPEDAEYLEVVRNERAARRVLRSSDDGAGDAAQIADMVRRSEAEYRERVTYTRLCDAELAYAQWAATGGGEPPEGAPDPLDRLRFVTAAYERRLAAELLAAQGGPEKNVAV